MILSPLARIALDCHLVQRGLQVAPSTWNSAPSIVGVFDSKVGSTQSGNGGVVKRFSVEESGQNRGRRSSVG